MQKRLASPYCSRVLPMSTRSNCPGGNEDGGFGFSAFLGKNSRESLGTAGKTRGRPNGGLIRMWEGSVSGDACGSSWGIDNFGTA